MMVKNNEQEVSKKSSNVEQKGERGVEWSGKSLHTTTILKIMNE